MLFIETSVFTSQIKSLISEDSYRQLQEWIADSPNRGDLIRGSSGCRKIRWMATGKGKRGGIRVIYYWHRKGNQVFMLLAYAKNQSADLSRVQVDQLAKLVRKEFGNK